MNQKTNIVLIGMPGSGKTTMGRWLAEAIHWDFLDTDDYMEETGVETVGEVIQRVGEDAFLDYERDLVLGSALDPVEQDAGQAPPRPRAQVVSREYHRSALVRSLRRGSRIAAARAASMSLPVAWQ